VLRQRRRVEAEAIRLRDSPSVAIHNPMKKVLELPAFRRLLVAAVLNELAFSIGSVALALLVYRRTGSAIGATAFFLCAQFGPALVAPFVVARLDQRSARKVLTALFALEMIIFLVLALLLDRLGIAPILILTLIDGLMAVTARVVSRAAWTSLTSAQGLMREANAAINTSLYVCDMVGPAIGGVVVAADGTAGALLVNVGLFLLATLSISTARGLPQPKTDDVTGLRRLREALAYTRREPLIRKLIGLEGIAILFFTISIPVEVVFAQHTLHAGAGGYGALLATWGAGAIGGSALYTRWRSLPQRTLMTVGAGLLGVGFLVMSVAPSLGVAIVGAVIAGCGNGIQGVAARTALQETASERWMALVLSLNEAMFQGVPGLGILLGGVIATLAGPRPALAVGAAGSLAVACAIWALLPPLASAKRAREIAPLPTDSQRPLTTVGPGP
jgi:predicted MFS family arabinose efflux permease